MPVIRLPDGQDKTFADSVTVLQVAESIGAGLARAALAGRVNGELVDISYLIENDAELAIVTGRDEDGLEIIRHSTAHLLAHAVKSLFPTAQVTIGPVIDKGFYYDFSYERPFTPEDLVLIEAKMRELAKQDIPVGRRLMSREAAIEFFNDLGEHYKVKIIEDIPSNQHLSFYQQGDFTDLCRGPHIPSTGKIKVFKLMKLAGAYWRGDSNNEMLQRIYGTAWNDKQQLKDHLYFLEEAEKRDHRKIAKALGLFHFQEEAPGIVFWHDAGWKVYQVIEQYMRRKLWEHGYEEVRTPQIMTRELWEASGHWDNYREEMFTTLSEDRVFAIKPMSCPGNVQIFKQGMKSYRDLPLRMAEFGNCHRNEPSGALHGLMRVRNFTQDDAHIFCTEEQIQDEVSALIKLLHEIYHDFGFEKVIAALSTRPEKRVGDDALWDKAEQGLKHALQTNGLEWQEHTGDGAFYGPKIDIYLEDCLGRVWQCATIQLDYCLPGRLGAEYIGEDGNKHTPIMIHRTIIGSIERFMGVLIEHFAGKLPVWLAPRQVIVMNITDRQAEYAEQITAELQKHGIRAKSDLRNEKIGYKIREHTLKRVPYFIIIGDKELAEQTVAVRLLSGDDLGSMTLSAFSQLLNDAIGQYCRIEGGPSDS